MNPFDHKTEGHDPYGCGVILSATKYSIMEINEVQHFGKQHHAFKLTANALGNTS